MNLLKIIKIKIQGVKINNGFFDTDKLNLSRQLYYIFYSMYKTIVNSIILSILCTKIVIFGIPQREEEFITWKVGMHKN